MKKTERTYRRAGELSHALHTQLLARPYLRAALRAGAGGCCAFVLALAALFERPLPLALALVAAMDFGPAAVCAYLGAIGGYAAGWGFSGALEFVAAGFLMLAGACLFHDIQSQERRWFVPAFACALYVLPGGVCLLGGRVHIFDVVFFAAKLTLLAVCTAEFSAGLRADGRGRRVLLLAGLAGCSGIILPGGLPLSMVLAAGAVFLSLAGQGGLRCAVACGLVLDATCAPERSICALLTLAALVCGGVKPQARILRAALFLSCCTAGVLMTGGQDALFLAGAALGTVLALPLEAPLAGQAQTLDAPESGSAGQKLEQLAAVLSNVAQMLARSASCQSQPQQAAVFDRAAQTLCSSCGKYGICWKQYASDTYLALSGAAGRIWQRGAAVREDLPAFFLARCCHVDSFLCAVNEALEQEQRRLQYCARLGEGRSILADHDRFLARALQRLAEADTQGPAQPLRFSPETGFRARGVRADGVSGDHGCSFTCAEWYYVLLCDGMGTGQEARQESRAAAGLLRGLIETGFDAQDALQALNGIYILRQDGGFSTVDLLQVSLVTGEGYLYKWGAAPSYLKQDGRVEKIGTASPPPGLGVGESRQAECVRLSLQRGQMLVLVSDGAAGDETEQYIRSFRGLSARELAAGILECGEENQTDDQTAVALRLRPSTACKKHSTGAKKILSKPHI